MSENSETHIVSRNKEIIVGELVGGFAPRKKLSYSDKKTNLIVMDNISFNEVLQNEISYMPMKTPVSVLQELLSRRGITPTYELVQIEGAIHEPTFRYRVAFNDKDKDGPLTAMGAGRSKKEAKHAAAKSLIDKLTGSALTESFKNIKHHIRSISSCSANTNSNDVLTINDTNKFASCHNILTPVIKETPSQNINSYDDKVIGNPIGWLQEMCMARRWPPPNYDTENEIGLPHERQFTISCTVLQYREIGKGKSKKIAKRIAAHKMWLKLQENPIEPSNIKTIYDYDANEVHDGAFICDEMNRRVTNILNRYADLKDAHIATITNQHSYKVSQFHKTLKSKFGKSLEKLQKVCLNDDGIDYVKFLQEIASEHQFDVTYVDIDEKSKSGRAQCLVQLSTLPVAVCQGAGRTSESAQANVARNALEYLKIMTKK